MRVKNGYIITKDGRRLSFSLHRSMLPRYAEHSLLKQFNIQYSDIEEIVYTTDAKQEVLI